MGPGISVPAHICIDRVWTCARAGVRDGVSGRRGNIDLHYTTERASISVGTEAPRLLEFFFLTAMISGSSESCARHVDRPIGEGRSRRGGTDVRSKARRTRRERVAPPRPRSRSPSRVERRRSTWRKLFARCRKTPEPADQEKIHICIRRCSNCGSSRLRNRRRASRARSRVCNHLNCFRPTNYSAALEDGPTDGTRRVATSRQLKGDDRDDLISKRSCAQLARSIKVDSHDRLGRLPFLGSEKKSPNDLKCR